MINNNELLERAIKKYAENHGIDESRVSIKLSDQETITAITQQLDDATIKQLKEAVDQNTINELQNIISRIKRGE